MDIAFEAVGSFGTYQKIISLIVILVALLSLFMSISFPFMTKKPGFFCKEKDSFDEFRVCFDKELCKNKFFEYKKNPEDSLLNFSYDFDLYCEKSYIPPLIGTTFFVGGILGSVCLSHIPDQKGRKEIYKILTVVIFILHLNVFLSFNEWHLVISNTLMGFAAYAYSMSTLIITEYVDRSIGGIVMSINNAIFPFSGILVALFFLFINNWRILFFITTLFSLFVAILAQKYFLESPRWLNSKNKFKETMDVFKQMAEINGNQENYKKFVDVNSNLIKKTESTLKEIKQSYNILEIFKFRSQRSTLLILTYVWFSSGFCFYGLILNLEHLGGNIFSDSIVTFIGEIISELASGYCADEFGRLIVLKFGGFLGGFGFILYELFNHGTMKTICVFLTSFGFSSTFNVIYIYSPEIFPTSIRSTVMGFLYLVSRLGALIVPSISAIIPHTPYLFGVLSIFSSYLCFRLTETLGKDIEDDLPEIKRQKSFLSTSNSNIRKSRIMSKKYFSKMSFNKAIVSDFYFKIDA